MSLIIKTHTMVTILSLITVLLMTLYVLISRRKENELMMQESIELASDYFDLKFELKVLKKDYKEKAIQIDEVHVLLETLLVTKKQKDIVLLVNNFTFNK